MNWQIKPTMIENWPKDIDYAMFIDENGNDSKINSIFKAITNNNVINENERYFTITGCIFEKNNYKEACDEISNLKCKYWNNGFYYDKKTSKEKFVCLHSREIRRHDGAFNDKFINHDSFMVDLTNTMSNIKCIIISVTIDLVEYLKQGYMYNVYETAFDFLLERYIFATKNTRKGILMLEARGKREDAELLKHIIKVMNEGKKIISSSEIKEKIVGVYFNPKWNKTYSHTFTGLEVADLLSYPIHQYIKFSKSNLAFEIVKLKIDRYPDFMNKGIKIFPNSK